MSTFKQDQTINNEDTETQWRSICTTGGCFHHPGVDRDCA